MFPIFLSLPGRTVVVVGGGRVGGRRARAAAAAGAAVRVVDPAPPAGASVIDGITWVPEAYQPDHLAGAALVFASAPAAVNARVVADAKARNVLVCDAAEPDRGDFTLPAVGRRGELVVAVGTNGAAPALARRVRDQMLAGVDDSFVAWVGILHELRSVLRNSVLDPAVRAALLTEFSSDEWLDRVRADAPAARAAMGDRVRASASSLPPGV
ncbi:precorrin-2 dehydrogenase/sirohydrochlorin ferrochelatase family protein [Fimbriiglobus ruber]|uniref:precorrin-2 dehydrogenase n=1 Tax=Fimbriiglobus ruber TaxID=1908690 RepID=A0A225DT10_9BACT|nr:NAD(P)-dependent oxidoreductase [Fimbriiglobus ruber]OWK40309.1 Siroheme synthase / Precorrin-2 oxidase [Fimbriiglobus ruber]